MKQKLFKYICIKHAVRTSLFVLVLLGLGACQQSTTRYDHVNDGSRSTGSVTLKTRHKICKRAVALKSRRYGRLSYRSKRRLLYDYVTHLKASISSKLNRPDGVSPGTFCVVRIKQRVDGCVRKIHFTQCISKRMRRSVREAIHRASPLPEAPHPDIFDDTVELKFKI